MWRAFSYVIAFSPPVNAPKVLRRLCQSPIRFLRHHLSLQDYLLHPVD